MVKVIYKPPRDLVENGSKMLWLKFPVLASSRKENMDQRRYVYPSPKTLLVNGLEWLWVINGSSVVP